MTHRNDDILGQTHLRSSGQTPSSGDASGSSADGQDGGSGDDPVGGRDGRPGGDSAPNRHGHTRTAGRTTESASSVAVGALQGGRGRAARTPLRIPATGWWDIVRRVADKVATENVSILSAGVAFYAMLAIFPALGAIVTLYALVADPDDVTTHFRAISSIIPQDVASIIDGQLTSLASRKQEELGIGVMIGVLFSVWSAHRGVDALVRAVTIAYEEKETRGFVRMNVLTYVMTLGAILLVVMTIALLVAVPAALAWLPVSGLTTMAGRAAGWVVFVAAVLLALSVLYRYAPPRRPANWRWVSPGALTGTCLWLAGSVGFSLYVSSFANYNETYGTLGAIIVLLLWFYLTSYSIVLGAALNAEMEHQTARDSTVGGDQPLGERGAYVADTLGDIP